jgi:hypothetical protein
MLEDKQRIYFEIKKLPFFPVNYLSNQMVITYMNDKSVCFNDNRSFFLVYFTIIHVGKYPNPTNRQESRP